MTSVRVLLSNPSLARVETGDADWFVAGTRPRQVAEGIGDRRSFGSVVETVQSLPGEYSLVSVERDPETTIRAYRGITSSFDVFYTTRPGDGTRVVGDHFRDVLSERPVGERTVPRSAGADHLLFGTRPFGSYVAEVGRLGHGEVLAWPAGEDPERRVVESLSVDRTITPRRAERRLDGYLSETLDAAAYERPMTMLSGGIDSTLIQSYLGEPSTASGAFDSSEFRFEVEYARRASEIVGSDHDVHYVAEEDCLDHVEAATAATGHPLQHLQTTLMHLTMAETPRRTYFNGQLADAIFGTGGAVWARLAWYGRHVAERLPAVSPEVAKFRRLADALRRPATDPDGSAMNFVIYSDADLVGDLVGERTVDERKERRLEYVRKRLDVDPGPGYASHMHLGHFIDFFGDNTVTPWRHAAHAMGKAMQTPFAGREVVETMLAVPASRRYATFARPSVRQLLDGDVASAAGSVVVNKHILKDLLAARHPEYDVRKRKGNSTPPYERFLADGPLSDAFDEYAVPEFVPPERRDAIREGSDRASWYALSYAVWRDRVLENDLEPFETTTVIER